MGVIGVRVHGDFHCIPVPSSSATTSSIMCSSTLSPTSLNFLHSSLTPVPSFPHPPLFHTHLSTLVFLQSALSSPTRPVSPMHLNFSHLTRKCSTSSTSPLLHNTHHHTITYNCITLFTYDFIIPLLHTIA